MITNSLTKLLCSTARRTASLSFGFLLLCSINLPAEPIEPPAPIAGVFDNYCYDCHDSEMKKGGLDLTELSYDPGNPRNFERWVLIHDNVSEGEMPPKKKDQPEASERDAFVKTLSTNLLAIDRARVASNGRATQRRLNRYEYEETLREILQLPYLEVKGFLPEDTVAHGFNKIGDALDVSHIQIARYLSAADFALRSAIAPQVEKPSTETRRYHAWDEGAFWGIIKLGGPLERRTFPIVDLDLQTDIMAMDRPRRPEDRTDERKERESMAVVVSTYEPTEIRFSRFRAPMSGRYKVRLSANSIWMAKDYKSVSRGRRSEPITLYSDTEPRILRKLGSFDVGPDPTVRELDVWLLKGETIRPDAARFFRSRPPHNGNPLMTDEGMPGVAFRWLEVEGPIIDEWPPQSHETLFSDLPISGEAGKVEALPENVTQTADAHIQRFLKYAYRHPIEPDAAAPFQKVFSVAVAAGYSFTDAMIAAYTGILSSPAFLYFTAEPGPLDDHSLAERLSYFLWNSPPDHELRSLADKGALRNHAVIREQTERMLEDPKSRRFVDAFLDYWLELRLIAGTAPDTELYPDYQLDDLLVESMIEETQQFFRHLIAEDLPAVNLVDSKFAMLNERLATHYGVDGVEGVDLHPVALPEESVRGGLLTQASVLKVTANGTTTSPVKRGAWIMDRVLGMPPPPPPPTVPAVEPDTRGATTIREQLAKHRSEESCNACHRKIDPAGFALESFDVMGGWRERYRALGDGEKVPGIGHNGIRFRYTLGPEVDSSGELLSGETFQNIRELKQLLARDEEQLAKNLLQQLIVYATGAPIGFSDRGAVAKLLENTRESGYGVRSLIHQIVQSDLFLNK